MSPTLVVSSIVPSPPSPAEPLPKPLPALGFTVLADQEVGLTPYLETIRTEVVKSKLTTLSLLATGVTPSVDQPRVSSGHIVRHNYATQSNDRIAHAPTFCDQTRIGGRDREGVGINIEAESTTARIYVPLFSELPLNVQLESADGFPVSGVARSEAGVKATPLRTSSERIDLDVSRVARVSICFPC